MKQISKTFSLCKAETPHSLNKSFPFPSPASSGNHYSTSCFYEFECFRYLPHVGSQNLPFCDLLMSCSTMLSRFSIIPFDGIFFFLFQAEWYSIIHKCLILFILSSTDKHLVCSHLLAIKKGAALNMGMQISLWDPDFNFFENFGNKKQDCWIIW